MIVRIVSILLTLAGAICGLYAALLWRRASQIPSFPEWGLPGTERMEPVDETLRQLEINAAASNQVQQSGELNKKAAELTALALGLGSVGSIVGLFVPS